MNSTINYYNNNAKEFCEDTLQAYMSQCRNMFLKHVVPNGHILDASFKYGETEKMRGERSFSDFTEEQAKQLFLENGFEVLEFELTGDVREGRADEMWCNVVVRK